MNVSEIEWWNSLKEKLVDSRGIMEQVEKISKAERERLYQEYQSGNKETRERLEQTIQTISIFRGHGLEKD